MTTILVGGAGILGSGFCEHLRIARAPFSRLSPPWGDPGAVAASLQRDLPPLLEDSVPSIVVWAAGVGHVGASREALDVESRALDALCATIGRLPADRHLALAVIFASSAGALFGGHGASEVSPASPPAPITAYGEEKLRQEGRLQDLAEQTGCRVVACRYSNLYGLASGRLPARGLVPTAVRATRLRQPMTVYVSPDTRRDLLFNTDAAAEALRVAHVAPPGFSTALVRHGSTRSVAAILSLIGHVSRRRVPVTYADRPETRLQPRTLRFATSPAGEHAARTPMETAVHRMMRAPMAA